MQEARLLSTQLTVIPYSPRNVDGQEEKAEDQLDRLMASVQQALTAAKVMQMEETDEPVNTSGTFNFATPHYRRNSEFFGSEDPDLSGLKSTNSEFDLHEDHIELIDFLTCLIEKTQMENEDLRSLAARQLTELSTSRRRTFQDLSSELGFPDCSEEELLQRLRAALRPDIACTMDDICEAEGMLCEVLRNQQDARVEVTLGTVRLALQVYKTFSEALPVAKKRLAASIPSPDCLAPVLQLPAEPCLPVPLDSFSHTDCELQVEELLHRLDFLKRQTLPSEVMHQVSLEKMRLSRTEQTMRREIDSLRHERAELQILSEKLSAQLENVKQQSEKLKSDQSAVRILRSELLQQQSALQELEKTLEAERSFLDTERSEWCRFASVQGEEVLTLKQKIEQLSLSLPPVSNDDFGIHSGLYDGELKDLDIRLKQAAAVIESEAGSAEAVTQDLNDIEVLLSKINPRRAGFRRVKVQLTSARNKLVNWKSKLALLYAGRLMSNLNGTIRVLGKTWNQHLPLDFLSSVHGNDFEDTHKTEAETPKTPIKSFEWTPETEEKPQGGSCLLLLDTVKRQEQTIARLRQELKRAVERVKQVETREEKVSEKESVLRSVERQLEVLSAGLEKRLSVLRLREARLVSAELADDRSAAACQLVLELYSQVRDDEKTVEVQSLELEQELGRVSALREQTSDKEARLALLQYVLSRESVRLEKDQPKSHTGKISTQPSPWLR